MNKINLMSLLIVVTTATLLTAQEPLPSAPSTVKTKAEKGLSEEIMMDAFTRGLIAGGSSAFCVDFLRHNVLPNADSLNLYGNYGICRDQLTGQVKIASAVGALNMYENNYPMMQMHIPTLTALAARVVGVVVGANIAAYARKLLAGYLLF